MSSGKIIVITAYGHGNVIEEIAVSLFDRLLTSFFGDENAEAYCDMINSLVLYGKAWISARIVSENEQYTLDEFFPFKMDSLLKYDDRTIQTILRETNNKDIISAFRDENETIQEKIFNNMSKRAAKIIKEDNKDMRWLGWKSVKESQKKILKLIRHLEDTGEIVTPHTKWEEW